VPLKFATNQSLTSVTALPSSVPTDNLILISTQTASNSATISFTTGLDSTYDMYEFKFIDIHARTNAVFFSFNLSTDAGSNYNVTKTTTNFTSAHNEADTDTTLSYRTNADLAQSTGLQRLGGYTELGSGADENMVGFLQLFNPSSTTYVKHFIATTQTNANDSYSTASFIAGYGNTTSAVNAVRFQMESGNFDGVIKMYGVKKS
jgi:hypothetical protein